jgi:hypothetical protein
MIAERLSAQLLAGRPAREPLAVVRRLLAVQGQDPRGARLAIRARSTGLTAAHVDRALTDERSAVITWLNRGTLHLVASDDLQWLHSLTTPPLFTGNARRLAQEGVLPDAAERAVAVIERALAEEGPLTRVQLRERIAASGVPTEGQALVHLLMLACLRGIAVRDRWSQASTPTRSCGTGSGRSARSIGRAPWPSSRGGTCGAMAPPVIAILRSGRDCPCATPAPGWRTSPASCVSARTDCSI